jgi:hypothetical protein
VFKGFDLCSSYDSVSWTSSALLESVVPFELSCQCNGKYAISSELLTLFIFAKGFDPLDLKGLSTALLVVCARSPELVDNNSQCYHHCFPVFHHCCPYAIVIVVLDINDKHTLPTNMPTNVPNYQLVPYQTSTVYHNTCINHAPTPIPNHTSTMHQHLCQTMHQPCTITCTICLNHQPCTSTPYQVPILYYTMYQPCTSTLVPYHVPTIYLKHIPYHLIMSYTMYHWIYQASTIKDVPQQSTKQPRSYTNICLNHAPNMCLKHVPMPQQYTKDLP